MLAQVTSVYDISGHVMSGYFRLYEEISG